jgi:hypothetical protein
VLLTIGLAWVGSALSCAPAATQLIVSVDTDLLIPSELDRVAVSVTGPTGSMAREEQALLSAASSLPLTLAVIPSGDVLGPIEVVAIGYRGGAEVVRRDAEVTLVRGETRVLPLFLLARCLGVTCAASETCGETGCASRVVAMLSGWTGTPPRIPRDAGPVDAPSVDAPGRDATGDAFVTDVGPRDAGPPCTSAAECDDGVDCTIDSCDLEGGCVHQPNDSVCEDDSVCTTDSCGASGCVHAANTAACDDGVFCNGFDTCGGTTCSTHVGNPCSGSTVCDEPGDRCTGCAGDADCPAPSMGTWSACGYTDGCDESANRTRTVRTFACSAGACVGSDATETEACTRSTGGTVCGMGSCGGYGACGGFAGTCAESGGTESRSCTDLVCTGGTCGSVMRSESRACTRTTSGMSCGATTCGAYGACGGFASTCAESGGTEARSCTDSICSGGSCGSVMRSESRACTRSTAGAACGGPSCGAWGPCLNTSQCATTGTQTRSCTPTACSGGTCAASGAAYDETQSCMRSTDGNACDVDRCSFGMTGTCTGGFCDGFSDCPEPCVCTLAGACRMGGSFCAI